MTTTVATTQPTAAPAHPRTYLPPAIRQMLHRLTGRTPDTDAAWPPPPTGTPGQHPPHQAIPADYYTSGAAVWAYIARRWLPAHVTETEASSVLVAYTVPGTGQTTCELVHATHLSPRNPTPSTPQPSGSPADNAGHARATSLTHRADQHGLCNGCADLAHFCWTPCPAARQPRSTPPHPPGPTPHPARSGLRHRFAFTAGTR